VHRRFFRVVEQVVPDEKSVVEHDQSFCLAFFREEDLYDNFNEKRYAFVVLYPEVNTVKAVAVDADGFHCL